MDICPLSGKPCEEEKKHQIAEIIDGNVKFYSLCDKCATSFFIDEEPVRSARKSGAALFERLLEFIKIASRKTEKCPNCGITLKEIEEFGRLGCIKCYNYFGDKVNVALKKDKIQVELTEPILPTTLDEYNKQLEHELEKALSTENYSAAIVLRQKINDLKTVQEAKKKLELNLNEAIKQSDFETAKQLKSEIVALVNQVLR
jgi:protein arginine kinase activator